MGEVRAPFFMTWRYAVNLRCSTLAFFSVGALVTAAQTQDHYVAVQAAEGSAPSATDEALQASIDLGVRYLVRTQKKDGSWGTPAPTYVCDVWSPVPSCFATYEVAVSAMAVSALLEVGADKPGVEEALRKGAEYLLARHPVKRVEPGHLYNIWTHSYALEAFARLHAAEDDSDRRAIYLHACKVELRALIRYEYVDGGWGYYDFNTKTESPGRGSTSFMTATVLVALRMAADQGLEVPQTLIDRALVVQKGSRGIDDSFAYSYSSQLRPHNPLRVGVSHKKGSLARTPACLLSLEQWGEPVGVNAFQRALDDLEQYGHFLLIARKYPFPHEAWYQNSGYFCFYGYYYAAMVTERLPADKRLLACNQMLAHLLPLQEPDGCWWDYQLFGYHKTYGTAYVLMTLGRCVSARDE